MATIVPYSKFFLGALLGPKGGDGGTTRGKQSDRVFHRVGPKTSGADRRLSWSFGVGFASATLNATNESLYISYQIRLHAYCVDSTTALRPAATSLLKRADPFSTISGWLARREELQARPLD
jgi:hypothetical protein